MIRSLSEWSPYGRTYDLDGAICRHQCLKASLIAPDGPDGRHFLVYDNFRALMRWNHSSFFAASVGLLADRISQMTESRTGVRYRSFRWEIFCLLSFFLLLAACAAASAPGRTAQGNL